MAYDVAIIGGGITGAGVLRDCALRGLKAVLIEKSRPGRQTTAASTHLVHGGIRYLLYDRLTTHTTAWDSGNIVRIAGDMLKRLPIVWPVYRDNSHGLETVETLLKAYEPFQRMKGGLPHLRLSAEDAAGVIPGLKKEGLLGALSFDEWWVDAPRLVERNLDSAKNAGAKVLENCEAVGLLIDDGVVCGVRVKRQGGEEEIPARVVVNAAGPWVDKISRMAGLRTPMRLRKGTHLVYDKPLVPVGLLLEAAGKGRYVFVVPFEGGTLVGPTDLDSDPDADRTQTTQDEIDYLLASVKRSLPDFPTNYSSTRVGARPILGQAGSEKLLSREYEIVDHEAVSGLKGFVTLAGGKLSDFRLMSKDAVDTVCAKLGSNAVCTTQEFTLAGSRVDDIPDFARPWRPLKKFLRGWPRLRELYSLAYLGAGMTGHLLGKLYAGTRTATAAEFRRHYGV